MRCLEDKAHFRSLLDDSIGKTKSCDSGRVTSQTLLHECKSLQKAKEVIWVPKECSLAPTYFHDIPWYSTLTQGSRPMMNFIWRRRGHTVFQSGRGVYTCSISQAHQAATVLRLTSASLHRPCHSLQLHCMSVASHVLLGPQHYAL